MESLRKRKLELESELEVSQAAYDEERNMAIDLKKEAEETEREVHELSDKLETEKRDAEKRRQLLSLLGPRTQENQEKLEAIVHKTKKKIISLQEMWLGKEQELEGETLRLNMILNQAKDKAKEQRSASDINQQKIDQLRTAIKEKELLETKYLKDAMNKFGFVNMSGQSSEIDENLQHNFVPRSSYTNQIMDILKNVARQKEETTKVIDDVKITQADINLLEGKLYRTYVEADSKIFDLARADTQMIGAYKMLTELHGKSNAMLETIRQTGLAKRDTRILNDSIHAERAKGVGEKVQQLSADLQQIILENQELQ